MDTTNKQPIHANDSPNAGYSPTSAAIPNHYDPGSSTTGMFMDSARSADLSVVGEELQQAETSLRRARNLRSPINALSPEIISHIFRMLRCPSGSRESDLGLAQRYPNVLLQVCHRWRQIVFAFPDVWSHIELDLNACALRNNRLLERADTFVTHSKAALLELHITTEFFETPSALAGLCRSVAPRLWSLELETGDHSTIPFFHEQSWLISLVSGPRNKAFARLRWRSRDSDGLFIVADDSTIEGPCFRIAALEESFEQFLLTVKILELENIYPPWTSYAHHGLVELILDTGHKSRFSISADQLEGILKASPGLRRLRFGLDVDLIKRDGCHDVQLNELQSLCLPSPHRPSQGKLLEMIYPGQMPLQLDMDTLERTCFRLASLTWNPFTRFIARCNITLLRIRGAQSKDLGCNTSFDTLRLLQRLPRLNVLVLESFRFRQPVGRCNMAGSIIPVPIGYNSPQVFRRIQLLHMSQCVLRWSDLRRTLNTHPTEELVIDGGRILAHRSEEAELEAFLRSISPN
ncbi:unnamed protein product [Rhizoctonia solani]|uniref:F-box domain-containing protein n=1 Tax=Rhizoctonia solani TaxID=456999 RepID=A0A8H3HG15_9AGAM|nr:unnamed protein product [Rhizoctonia solani]